MVYFLNVLIIIMLGVTIAYAVRLNSKLKIIKNEKLDFANSIKAFNDSTQNAIVAVEDLHIKGEQICKLIDEKIKAAQLASDELEFLSSRAIKKLSELKASSQPQQQQFSAQPQPRAAVNSIAEAELLKALRNREYQEALLAS